MNEETNKTARMVLAEIANARQYSELPTPHELFISSETIISGLATLIGPLMDAETNYRQKVRGYMEKDYSNAKAEAFAQTESEYREWKKLKYVYELAQEQIMLIKKFSADLQQEYQRTK